jgi:hypothetical protein
MPGMYLNEFEVGFDPSLMGFPSIHGCLALVICTENGLFGYHNAGGSASDRWQPRATKFKEYIDGHFLRGSKITRLYGTTFVDADRGYSAPVRTSWINELTTFATTLGFGGKIRGYNLSAAALGGSAYVEYRKKDDKCEIWIKRWSDGDRTNGPNDAPMHHKLIHAAGFNLTLRAQTGAVVTAVAPANMQHVKSERLRS